MKQTALHPAIRLPIVLRLLSFLTVVPGIWVAYPAHAVEFQVPQRYAVPATYSVAGSTVKGEQANPAIGYWGGGRVLWRSAFDREQTQDKGLLGTGRFGYVMRWLTNFEKRYASTDEGDPFDIRDRAQGSGTLQGNMRGYGQLIRLVVPLSPDESQHLGFKFSPQPPPDKGSGSWRQQFNAQSTIRINKPGAAAGEKTRVRVVGEITGQSSGKDLQHSALEAKILIDQVVDLRIAGPNPNPSPRVTIDKYVDVPVNTDLRWQVSFNIYASGQQGTTDCAVSLTKQEITLELPSVPGSFISVPPPVKPLTGGAVGAPTPGTIVIPGQSSGGTTLTRPGTGTSLNTPAPGGTSVTLGTQGTLPAAPNAGTSAQRPFGTLVIPRGVENEGTKTDTREPQAGSEMR